MPNQLLVMASDSIPSRPSRVLYTYIYTYISLPNHIPTDHHHILPLLTTKSQMNATVPALGYPTRTQPAIISTRTISQLLATTYHHNADIYDLDSINISFGHQSSPIVTRSYTNLHLITCHHGSSAYHKSPSPLGHDRYKQSREVELRYLF